MQELIPQKLDLWEQKLFELIIEAYKNNQLIRNNWYNINFTPKGLAGCIIKGRFRWGIVNWNLIPREGNKIDFGDENFEGDEFYAKGNLEAPKQSES